MTELESKLNASTDFLGVASLGGVILSGILLFTPARAVGYIGVGSGLGAFTASVVTRKKHLLVVKESLNRLVNGYEVELKNRDSELVSKDSKIFNLNQALKQHISKEEAQTKELTKLQEKVSALTVQNQSKDQIIEKVTEELDRLITLARTAVEESLDEWQTKLSSLVETKREQYPKLTLRLNALLDEGQGKLADYALKLAQTPSKWDSLGDLLSLYYCLNDDLSHVKTKIIQSIAKLTNQETQLELQEVSEILQEWQVANLVPRDKLEHIIKN